MFHNMPPLADTKEFQPADAAFGGKLGVAFILNAEAVEPGLEQRTTLSKKEEMRLRRTCRVDGCDKYIVRGGRCCRHGGTKICSVVGCSAGVKYRGVCWKHGGFSNCTVEGCAKKAKTRGVCWKHGGGTKCQRPGCSKLAISNGCCWAHGGGKPCVFQDCAKPGYGRTAHFCEDHFEQLQGIEYFEV